MHTYYISAGEGAQVCVSIYNWHKYLLRIVEATNCTIQIVTTAYICIFAHVCMCGCVYVCTFKYCLIRLCIYICISMCARVCVILCKYTTIFSKITTAHFMLSTTYNNARYCCSSYKVPQQNNSDQQQRCWLWNKCMRSTNGIDGIFVWQVIKIKASDVMPHASMQCR